MRDTAPIMKPHMVAKDILSNAETDSSKKLDLTPVADFFSQNDLRILINLYPHFFTNLESLRLEGFKKLTQFPVRSAKIQMMNLKRLNLKGCIILPFLEIPSGVTSVEPGAFEDCPNLDVVTCDLDLLADINRNKKMYFGDIKRVVHVVAKSEVLDLLGELTKELMIEMGDVVDTYISAEPRDRLSVYESIKTGYCGYIIMGIYIIKELAEIGGRQASEIYKKYTLNRDPDKNPKDNAFLYRILKNNWLASKTIFELKTIAKKDLDKFSNKFIPLLEMLCLPKKCPHNDLFIPHVNRLVESFLSVRDQANLSYVTTKRTVDIVNSFVQFLEAKNRCDRKSFRQENNSLLATLSTLVKKNSPVNKQEITREYRGSLNYSGVAYRVNLLMQVRPKDRTPEQHSVIQRLKNQVRDFPC